jgi:hypothetical protein
MALDGYHLDDLFSAFRGTRVAAAHNIHKQHSQYQQEGKLMAAFTRFTGFVTSTGVDHTGLGRWSWIQVGTGEHCTRIVLAYQPCHGSSKTCLGGEGQVLHGGTMASKHHQYFRKKGIFTNPWKAFTKQLTTQLRAWRAAGKGIILFTDMNENVYTRRLTRALWLDGLLMEEQTLRLTGKEAPHSHQAGEVAIVGTFATLKIVCTNSSLLPHGAGTGDNCFQVHDFDAQLILSTKYSKTTRPSGRALQCKVA